jgi:predicted enzyme related to lactoylglutathione lyase
MPFYQGLFGWEYRVVHDSAGADFVLAVLADEPVAGLRPHPGAVRDWTLYLATDDLAAAGTGCAGSGGTVLEARPHAVPGVGVKVLVDDGGGATVGLAQPAADWAFGAGAPGGLGWVEFVMRQGDRFFQGLLGTDSASSVTGRPWTTWSTSPVRTPSSAGSGWIPVLRWMCHLGGSRTSRSTRISASSRPSAAPAPPVAG